MFLKRPPDYSPLPWATIGSKLDKLNCIIIRLDCTWPTLVNMMPGDCHDQAYSGMVLALQNHSALGKPGEMNTNFYTNFLYCRNTFIIMNTYHYHIFTLSQTIMSQIFLINVNPYWMLSCLAADIIHIVQIHLCGTREPSQLIFINIMLDTILMFYT